ISWLQRYDYGRRASGFYICPNHLAGLLEVVGVMGLSIVCWSRWPVWGKLLVGYAVGVCYVGQILTGSRGGYLSAVASLAVFGLLSFLILRRTGGRQAWALLGAGGLAVVILGAAAAFYVSRSDFLKDRAQTTFDTRNMRVELWKSALQQWKLQPIIGTGSATYLYYGRLLRSPEVQLDPVYTHNDYLQLLAEYGLVAVAGLLAFLFAHARAGLRNFSRLGPRRVAASHLLPSNALALNVGSLSAVGSYLVHSIFDFNLHIPANVLLLAFVFGILANDGVMRERAAVSAKAIVRGWWFALPILGIALLVECARLLPGEYFSESARAAVRDYQPGLALRYANAGLKYDRTNPELFHWLGAANLQFADASPTEEAANSFREAGIRALENARSLFPQEQSYALRVAGACDDLHQFDRAESVFADLHRLDPKSTSLQKYYEGHRKMWEKALAPGVDPARPDAGTGAANGKL
ncbi:MAG: O-antigen ligase family protein, partial [Chthoniobacterales bacterium]